MKRVPPVTLESIAKALQAFLDARPDFTHGYLAELSGLDRSVVTRMFSGSNLTISNLSALLGAMGVDWHELIDVARCGYKPRDLREDLAETIGLLADLQRERRGKRR